MLSAAAAIVFLVGRLKFLQSDSIERWSARYESALCLFLLISIALIGVGRAEILSDGVRISAWSISRTAFFFWLGAKLAAAWRGRSGRADFLRHPIPISLLVFFFLIAASLLPDFRAAGDFRYFLFGCMHALMVMDLFKTAGRIRWLVLLLALSPAVFTLRGVIHDPSLLSIAQIPDAGVPLQRRLGFPMDHPNTAGYVLSMSIPLAAAVFVAETGWLRWVSVAAGVIQGLGLMLTYSRGAWVGAAAAMLFLLAMAKQWKALLGIFIVTLLLFTFVDPLRSRAVSLTQPRADPAIRDRMRFMGDSLELGYDNPVLGIGYGRGRLKEGLRESYKGTADEKSPIWHAHNVYVELFAETGILGLSAFLWLLGCAYLEMLRVANGGETSQRIIVLGAAAAWTAAAVTGLGDVPFYHHETRIFFFTLLALAFAFGQAARLDRPAK